MAAALKSTLKSSVQGPPQGPYAPRPPPPNRTLPQPAITSAGPSTSTTSADMFDDLYPEDAQKFSANQSIVLTKNPQPEARSTSLYTPAPQVSRIFDPYIVHFDPCIVHFDPYIVHFDPSPQVSLDTNQH
eukprot:880513-Prorocentrum_minimum.AAC.2